jgi:hypothetical protein
MKESSNEVASIMTAKNKNKKTERVCKKKAYFCKLFYGIEFVKYSIGARTE